MKLQDLFEAADNPFSFAKELNAQFKALAKENGLTTLGPMGWPAISKDGAWFGGGFQPAGGAKKAEAQLVKLPLEVHVKGFVNELAPILEKLIQQGHEIAVGEGAQYGVKHPVVPGKVKEALLASMRMQKPKTSDSRFRPVMPCIVWYVSIPKELAGTELLRVSVNVRHGNRPKRKGVYTDPRTGFMLVTTSTPEKNKVYVKKFEAFNKTNRADYDLKTSRTTPASDAWVGMAEDFLALAVKSGFNLEHKDPIVNDHGAISLSRKIGAKGSIQVDLNDVTKILDKYL